MKPMSATEYRRALAALELSQGDAAKFLDLDPRTSRRWALDEVRIPQAAAILLRYMMRKQLTVADVLGG
jgi:DNA-binding transcriptional regulator YiaG